MTKKMKTKKNKKILALIVCLLALLPSSMYAQFSFDVTSVEAYINDHKEQRSLLLVRSTLEASNKLLHDYSGDANKGFRDINKELDKYTRAFDVIDVLYQSLRTSLNVYNTYENISDRIGDYKDMLSDFKEKCLERGNIVSTDTMIVTINMRALANIAEEGDNLIVIPEEEGEINVAWFMYEFIALAIPMKHVHAPGKCNKAVTSKLSKHLKTDANEDSDEVFDTGGDDIVVEEEMEEQIDPRWNELKKILDNN